jgi:predicted DCC family thiol-disulfide oxidoreductase YuxK
VSSPAELARSPVLLYDGSCGLCQGSVQWLLRRDRRGVLRFAALQSKAAAGLLAAAGAIGPLPDSVVLLDGRGVHVKSAAALAVAGRLGLPWSLARVFWLVPRPLRDWVYDWVARNRYRWFGRKTECLLPTPALRARFLDLGE